MCAVPQGANPLAELIRAEIGDGGPMPFARFMALALYHPEFGYYNKDTGQVGRRGDFVTSVSVGAVFGQLLAFRFAKWLGAINGPVRIAEAGAHDGRLASDILEWLAANDEPLFSRLTYTIAEPSAKRRSWQAKRLAKFAEKIEWHDTLADTPEICGVIFSNELLDAFPAHRIGWDAAKRDWFEWAVGWRDGAFRWEQIDRDGAAWRALLPAWPSELLDVLPGRYTTELSPKANAWWRTAADKLAAGKLIAFDYGHGPGDWPAAKSAGRNRTRLPRPKTRRRHLGQPRRTGPHRPRQLRPGQERRRSGRFANRTVHLTRAIFERHFRRNAPDSPRAWSSDRRAPITNPHPPRPNGPPVPRTCAVQIIFIRRFHRFTQMVCVFN